MTKEVQWESGAVCYETGTQWISYSADALRSDELDGIKLIDSISESEDFQLNRIREGDYIGVAELDTEQKYNDVVEVFGLFGFEEGVSYNDHFHVHNADCIVLLGGWVDSVTGEAAKENHCKRQLTYSQIMAIGKIKHMMDGREKSATKEALGLAVRPTKASANKYERVVFDRYGDSAHVDVYDVLQAFEVTCPATQHAVKKLLCSGLRGHKDLDTDLEEAKESINRAIELAGIK